MILVDFNQVVISNLMSQLHSSRMELNESLVRHMVLSSIHYFRGKFSDEFGEMVFCCDGRKYWRKTYFKYYKANRKKLREKSDYDWNLIFGSLNKIRDEIDNIFPYKVVLVDEAEADDIIATMCEYLQENELDGLLVDSKQKVLILSSDKDFLQLQKYDNVKQYSPILKKFIYTDDPQEYLIEHLMKGDSGDGVPNIVSSDDSLFDENKKQSKLTKKRKEAILEQINTGVWTDSKAERNFYRNKEIIDLSQIPKEVKKDIIESYHNAKVPDRSGLFKYFVMNKLKLLTPHINDF